MCCLNTLYVEQNRKVSATSLSPLFGLYINFVMMIEICTTAPILSFLKFLGASEHPVKWVSGTLSSGAKRPDHEAEWLCWFGAEVKNACELYLHTAANMASLQAQGNLLRSY